MSKGIRSSQINPLDQHGTNPYIQQSDGTGILEHIAKYNANGSVTNSDLVAGDVLTSPGGGTGATVGGLGSPYEQIPIGVRNGANRDFYLDFIPITPPTGTPPVVPFWLHLNGLDQSPYAPTPRYTLAPGSNHIVMTVAPKETDEFWCQYFRGPAAPLPSPIASAVLTLVYTYTHSAMTDGFVKLQHGSDLPLLYDNTAYTNRTFTFTMSPIPAGFGTGGWPVSLEVYNSLFQDGTDVLQLFEIYADVTYADATTARIYPTAARYPGNMIGYDPSDSEMSISHATGDGTTATYTYSLTSGPALAVGMLVRTWNCTTAGFNIVGAEITALGTGTFSIANTTVGSEAESGALGEASIATFYGSVVNVANALDGNLSTYATFTRDHYYPTRSGGGVNFSF